MTAWREIDPMHGKRENACLVPDLARDAREYALRAFADWLTTVEFRRPGNKGQTLPFKLSAEQVFVDIPDANVELRFPCAVFVPTSPGEIQTFGIGGGNLRDETEGLYGPGSALIDLAEYTEEFTLELWATKPAELRAMFRAIETSIPLSEGTSVLRLRLLDYYDAPATFALGMRAIDDALAVQNRRSGSFLVRLTTVVTRLVDVVTLKPYVAVEVTSDLDCCSQP